MLKFNKITVRALGFLNVKKVGRERQFDYLSPNWVKLIVFNGFQSNKKIFLKIPGNNIARPQHI